MMETPWSPRVLPMCRDIPNRIFHVPSLCSGDVSLTWDSMILQVFSNQNYSLVLFGKEQWEAVRVPCQPAGGFALCWIKPDLLILS